MKTARSKEKLRELDKLIDQFGRGLDRNDCASEAWIACMEAEKSYRSYAGCCSWETYLSFRVQERLELLRRQRSQQIQIQSPFSLDQPVGEKGETALNFFPSCQGSFESSVLFWDYVRHLEGPLREIARCLAHGDSAEEVMEELNMDRSQFDFWKSALREELEQSYF